MKCAADFLGTSLSRGRGFGVSRRELRETLRCIFSGLPRLPESPEIVFVKFPGPGFKVLEKLFGPEKSWKSKCDRKKCHLTLTTLLHYLAKFEIRHTLECPLEDAQHFCVMTFGHNTRISTE